MIDPMQNIISENEALKTQSKGLPMTPTKEQIENKAREWFDDMAPGDNCYRDASELEQTIYEHCAKQHLLELRASEQRVVELEGLLNKSYNNLAHHHRCSLHRESDTRLLETIYKAISKTSISQSKEAP
jgi:hypothetical protein